MEEIDDLLREELQQPQITNKVLTPTIQEPKDIMNLYNEMYKLMRVQIKINPESHKLATPMFNNHDDLVEILNNILPNSDNSKIDELLREELDELENSNSEDSDDSYGIVQTKMLSDQQGRKQHEKHEQKIKCNHCYKKMADYVCTEKKCKSL